MASFDIAHIIPLTKGLEALVSPQDFDLVREFKWVAAKGGRTHYASQTIWLAGGKKTVRLMHRLILAPPKGVFVDHINGNGLDNRRENLRLCSHAQNIRNQQPQVGTSSRFKGVWMQRGKWAAMIQHNGDKITLGRFDCEERAARQYDRAARVFFGRFARTNQDLGLFEA